MASLQERHDRAARTDHGTDRAPRAHHAGWPGRLRLGDVPTRLVIDGQVVHLDADPVGDDTVLVTRGHNDHFALLVVPPDTTADAAREAMARAVRADNITQATQILIATTAEPEDGAAEAAG